MHVIHMSNECIEKYIDLQRFLCLLSSFLFDNSFSEMLKFLVERSGHVRTFYARDNCGAFSKQRQSLSKFRPPEIMYVFLDAERELDVSSGCVCVCVRVCARYLRNGKKASVSIGGGPETSHPISHLEGACLGLRSTEREGTTRGAFTDHWTTDPHCY